MNKVISIVYLDEMPMDRWDYDKFVHATGRLLVFDDGSELIEYEDTIDFQDWDESEATEYWEEDYYGSANDDYSSNMPCDNTGFCSGSTCPDFIKCKG